MTTQILADSTPSAGALHNWLLVLGFLVGIGVGVKTLFARKPGHAELATKSEVDGKIRDLEDDMNGRFDRIEVKMSDEQRATMSEVASVHRRIDKVMENTSEIRGELKQINSNLDKLINQKLSN